MSVTEISVKRPAAVIMFVLLFIGLGIFGYKEMGADLLPSINFPIISVTTTYNGAGSEDIKNEVVKPIEDAVSGISGIDENGITSSASEGVGRVMIKFTSDTDINTALMDVEKAVNQAERKLPQNADKPVLMKFDSNAIPILQLSISGNIPYEQLYNEADNMKDDLERIPGVGNVSLQGGKEKQLQIKIDKTALEYYGISINTIINKLNAENINVPAGDMKQDKSTETVRLVGEFESPKDVENLLIPLSNGGNMRIGDIAKVELAYPDDTDYVRFNSKSSIGIIIQKQSDANVVAAANGVKTALKEIEKTLPEGVHVTVASDNTTFINSSLKGVRGNLIEGVITTSIVLFLFLRSLRSSIIVLISIPTALITTFFMMYVCKFTLNMMSLMALSLCIGILVDDSIVILENIQRHLNYGEKRMTAAIEGRKEIGMAAIAITLCDVVVFAPIAVMSGVIGQYFRQFGLTIVFASLLSLAVSFTLTPMLASKLLKRETKKVEPKVSKKSSGGFQKVVREYRKFLVWSLNNRWKIVCIITAMVVISIALIPMGAISTEFMPQTDQSQFTINMSLNPSTSLQQTDTQARRVENYLKGIREIKTFYTHVSQGSVGISVTMVDKTARKRSQSEVAAQVRGWGSKSLAGMKFSVSENQTGGSGGRGGAVEVDIMGPNDQLLNQISDKVESLIQSVPGTVDITNSTRTRQNQVSVKVDRLAESQYGVSASDVSAALSTAINGTKAGVYRENGNDHDIQVKFNNNEIRTLSDIGSIKVVSQSGKAVPLNQVAIIKNEDSPVTIDRMNREDEVEVTANLQGAVLGDVTKAIQAKLKDLHVPSGYTVQFGQSQKMMSDSFKSLGEALAVSIILVYMILVVLYESFITPFVRLLSLPCAIIGAFGFLALAGQTLNMTTMIGLIMLDGMSSKNGTLLIDYTNTIMKRDGLPLREALVEAGITRFKPIMMTTITMIVSMVPVALAMAEGAEMKRGMAILIIGGMTTSTIFSPILIPVAYTLLDDLKGFVMSKFNKNEQVEM